MTSHPPHGSHPTTAFHTGTGKATQPIKLQDDLVYHLNALVLSARDPTPLQIARQLQVTKSLSLQRVSALTAYKVSACTAAVSAIASTIRVFVVRLVPRGKNSQRLTLPPQKLSNLLLRGLQYNYLSIKINHSIISYGGQYHLSVEDCSSQHLIQRYICPGKHSLWRRVPVFISYQGGSRLPTSAATWYGGTFFVHVWYWN